MQILIPSLIFIFGLFILIFSSNYLIQASVRLAQLFRLSMSFIAAVFIAFGTSAPEAGVGIVAAIRNVKGIALGNIIGSNIANIGLIVGACALFAPIKVEKKALRREVPFMLFATVLFYVLLLDSYFSRFDSLLFLLIFLAFCVVSYKGAKQSFDEKEISGFAFNNVISALRSKASVIVLLMVTLFGVVWGADLMVRSGSQLAEALGVPGWIVGVTVFAVGTSLPELVTSLMASIKNISSISVGNIVGSNIFNILFVLGIVGLIRPFAVARELLFFELPVLLGFTFAFFTSMCIRCKISRWEGLLFFSGYILFIFLLLVRG